MIVNFQTVLKFWFGLQFQVLIPFIKGDEIQQVEFKIGYDSVT